MLRQGAARLLGQRIRQVLPQRACQQQIRRMGGGHSSGAPHPSQPKAAFIFNEGPGARKVEIWEHITSITYWSTFFILVMGLANAPETRIKVRYSNIQVYHIIIFSHFAPIPASLSD